MEDSFYMKKALRLARRGLGRTAPNPVVGAVVVRKDEVVGRGYHQQAGGPHAEVHALRDAGDAAQGATLYVTLEPCNHQGRTPPCTKAILKSGIGRVVVGMRDPNPSVEGGGNKYLTAQGVEVVSGVLEEACQEINRPFSKLIQNGRPWVALKAGLSLDGRIAVASGKSGWITNEKSRRYVHRLRNEFDAILVGSGTAINDNPSLTTRLSKGRGRDPLRVVLDSTLQMSTEAQMLTQNSAAETLIFCSPTCHAARRKKLEKAGAVVLPIQETASGSLSLEDLLDCLGSRGISSLLVEGGGQVHGSFLRSGLADQAYFFYGPMFVGSNGIPVVADLGVDDVRTARRLKEIRTRKFDNDVLIEGIF